MSDVQETLQELMHRRLREMGSRRGRETPLNLREAHEAIKDSDGKALVSYETARQIHVGTYKSKLSEDSADGLAAMLDMSASEILEAAGQRRRLGKFSLPRRADRLDDKERRAVLAVVDAILDAAKPRRESTPSTAAVALTKDERAVQETVSRFTGKPGKKTPTNPDVTLEEQDERRNRD